ncbi:hypothetical protein U9M48_019517 [Paspalum notatum var. saurae]|uniref:Uncharacterized protein n=1 Tax=Paspalum notatum var. saurae TaxID=547442 RepID=A0AAQ3WQT4_PASNO
MMPWLAPGPVEVEPFVRYCFEKTCPPLLREDLPLQPGPAQGEQALAPLPLPRAWPLQSLLWLQFKPHHIAAGAAFLAAKFLRYDIMFHSNFWHEFKTSPYIVQDVVQQLKELL